MALHEVYLSSPKERPHPSGNVLVLNHAERVVSRMMKRARGPRSVSYRRSTSSAAPWTREESRTRQNERAQGPNGSEWTFVEKARKRVAERGCGRSARLCGDSKAGEGLRVASLDQIKPIKSARLVFEAVVVAGFLFFFFFLQGRARRGVFADRGSCLQSGLFASYQMPVRWS